MTTPIVDKLPPHDRDAEEAVIASVMVDPDAFDAIETLVATDDFYHDETRFTFAACRALWGRSEDINQVTVAHELARADRLEAVGGMPWLSRLVAELPTPIGVEHYAGIVRRDATYRRMITAGTDIVQRGYRGGPNLDAELAAAEGIVSSLHTEHGSASNWRSIGSLLDEFWEGRDPQSEHAVRTVRTGLMDVDAILAGIAPSNLVIVAAQTGVGKSTFLLNIARNAAAGQGYRVGIVSLEMSEDEWRSRLLARESGVPIDRLRLQGMSDRESAAAMNATAVLQPLPIEIDDRPTVTVEQLRSKLRRLRLKLGGLDLVLVDYLQLLGGGRRFENRTQEVSAISRGLKMLARELSVPIIAAAQLKRIDDRNPPIPRLSDLRESGAIEQDADVVMFLYRTDKTVAREDWKGRGEYPAGVMRIIVAKQRNGPTGSADVRVDDAIARVEDKDPPEEPDPQARFAEEAFA